VRNTALFTRLHLCERDREVHSNCSHTHTDSRSSWGTWYSVCKRFSMQFRGLSCSKFWYSYLQIIPLHRTIP
jgi:hypothetical protein